MVAVSPAAGSSSSGDRIPPLAVGQSVRFRILPSGVSGEARIRIGAFVLSAFVPRPIPAGTTGTALVKRAGHPILLQLTEISPPPAREPVRIPLLTGREPLRGGPFPPSALERWNEALVRQYPADLQALSPERLKEGILLTRFLSDALAAGMNRGAQADSASDARESGAPRGDAVPRDDVPFWFFLPTPGEKAPVVFPGHRRKDPGERTPSWGIFLRLPGLGAVSVRFQPVDAGWRIAFTVEQEGLERALAAGADDLAGRLRDKGFPLRDVTVRRMPRGRIDAEVAARMSRDTGLPLLERRA